MDAVTCARGSPKRTAVLETLNCPSAFVVTVMEPVAFPLPGSHGPRQSITNVTVYSRFGAQRAPLIWTPEQVSRVQEASVAAGPTSRVRLRPGSSPVPSPAGRTLTRSCRCLLRGLLSS